MKRCEWANSDETYIEYHDNEWGVPVHDDRRLFEMLVLEGAQAGLSWLIILKRRESFRVAYDEFDPKKIATWSDAKIRALLKNPGIIRNRLKIEAARTNACAFLRVVEDMGSFDEFIWSFVDGKPIQNSWQDVSMIPATTTESDRMSKDLKRRGFKFVGSTICYAYMQSVGIVNDHLVNCFRYGLIRRKGTN